MQFPYACQSFKSNYSTLIKRCYASATSYMPLDEERQFGRRIPDIHFLVLIARRITSHCVTCEAKEAHGNQEEARLEIQESLLDRPRANLETEPLEIELGYPGPLWDCQ